MAEPALATDDTEYVPIGQTEPVSTESAQPPNFLSDAGYDPEASRRAQDALIPQFQEKREREDYATRVATGRLEEDRRRMDDAYRRSAASRDDPALRPWNADQERADRIRGPMEQFGSIGSIFAMAASMFTKTPMTSALNAGAAAMTAIQNHDEKAYQSAYQAWKANSDLALRRFDMERNLFQDANRLAETDLRQWAAQRLAIAAQFDDRKVITLLENGMYKEVLDLDATKVNTAEKLRLHQQGMEQYEIQRQIFQDGVRAFEEANPDATPAQKVQNRLQLLHDIKSGVRSWQQEALRNFMLLNPNATQDQINEFLRNLRAGSLTGQLGNPNLTADRQRAADVAKARERWKAEGLSDEEIAVKAAELEKQLKAAATPVSANQRDKLASQLTRFDLSMTTIDKIEALLKKHKAMAGLGGTITRPAEVVGNWFGSNETDRAQFRRYIAELQEWGPRLLNESGSRPLSSEETRIQAIVPGLSLGDTTANTARGLLELRDLMRKMRDQLKQRIEGTWTPEKSQESAGSKSETPAATAKPRWQDAPVVRSPGKRSEVISDEVPYPAQSGKRYAQIRKAGQPDEDSNYTRAEREAASSQGVQLPAPYHNEAFVKGKLKALRDDGINIDEQSPEDLDAYIRGDSLGRANALINMHRKSGRLPAGPYKSFDDEERAYINESTRQLRLRGNRK